MTAAFWIQFAGVIAGFAGTLILAYAYHAPSPDIHRVAEQPIATRSISIRGWYGGLALIALAFVLQAASMFCAPGITEQVTTKRLLVVDEAGQRRAELAVTNSVPALYLAGRDGVDRAWLEVAGDAPRLVFRDDKKRQRLVLGGFSLSLDSGVTEVRPTSSLVLITEDGKIWRAP
jgi:hypothetical protein